MAEDIKEFGRGLKVDYRVRYAITSAMKWKRRLAIATVAMAGFMALYTAVAIPMHWPGGDIMFLMIPLTVAFLAVGILTLVASKRVMNAMETNNQATFDEAMSMWNRRCMVTFWAYMILLVVIILLEVGMAS